MTKFKIGQKVICITEFKVKRKHSEQFPIKGKTYTIRGFIEYRGRVGVLLEEIVNPKYQYIDGFSEAAFGVHNFRPIEHQSAKSEILQKFKITEERLDGEMKEAIQQETTNKQ